VAGLGLFDQKSLIAVTIPIATALKFFMETGKWAPESLTDRSSFLVFLTRFLYREWHRHHQSLAGGPTNSFWRVAPGVGQNCPGNFHDDLGLLE
jgi:hypothetical protein